MKTASKITKQDQKIIRDVIKRFGPIINLEETPFVLTEILRNFGPTLMSIDGGLPPGGIGVGGPAVREISNSAILKEVLKLSREVSALKAALKNTNK